MASPVCRREEERRETSVRKERQWTDPPHSATLTCRHTSLRTANVLANTVNCHRFYQLLLCLGYVGSRPCLSNYFYSPLIPVVGYHYEFQEGCANGQHRP